MTKTSLTVLAAALLSACSLAPTYQRPAAPVAEPFPAALPAGGATPPGPVTAGRAAVDIGWREFFTDERLQQLIATALENNRDLRTAALRIE